MNQLVFVGNLGKDAEARTLPNGTSVTNFSVAMTAGFGDNQKTTWVNCSLWGKKDGTQHGLTPHLTKGAKVTVIGECWLRQWESEGKSGATLECRVGTIDLTRDGPQEAPAPKKEEPKAVDPMDDEIPF